MKRVVMATCTVGLLALSLAGCAVNYSSDDETVGRRFGSDYLGAGGSVNLTETVDGDAFLAGGHVATASEVKGDLIAAGGEVSVGGSVGDDLYAGGGEVQVDAIVNGNARVAGGEVTLGPATVVIGSLAATGGQIRVEGDTHGDVHIAGGNVTLDGTIGGDAEIEAEDVDIGPQTRIAGKLTVHSARRPAIPAGAQIAGGVEYHHEHLHRHHDGATRDVHTVAHGVGSIFWIIGVFVAATLFTLAFPAYSARAADWIGREPLRSLGLGFVVVVCLPVLAVLLLVTIVGIPLALIIVLLYLLLLFLGWITAAMFVGRKGLTLLRGSRAETAGTRLLALLLAIIALWLVGHVPLIGGWVKFAALLLGIGALVWQGWPRRDPTPRGAT